MKLENIPVGISEEGKLVYDSLEECVACGEQTKVKKSQHIDERATYVSGVGQVCVPCYLSIYGENYRNI